MPATDGITLLWLMHACLTWFMTGVIWFVQVVHYPLFSFVSPSEFTTFQHQHMQRTSRVVVTPMLFELGSAVFFLAGFGPALPMLWLWVNAALVVAVFGVTFGLQVPCHQRLQQGYQAAIHRRLVLSNWLRTVLWSLRALLVLWLTWHFSPLL